MQREYSFKPELDMKAVDELLEYTRRTHPDSLGRQSLVQSRSRASLSEKDLCQVYMFLMGVEIERLNTLLKDNSNMDQMQKHIEGMQQSNNQWRLKFHQKEEEVEELKAELKSVGDQSHRIMMLEQQIKALTHDNISLRQSQITNSQVQRIESSDIFIELKRELTNLQGRYQELFREFEYYKSIDFEGPQTQREVTQLNIALKELAAENQKLKQELYKQNRRTDTWCC